MQIMFWGDDKNMTGIYIYIMKYNINLQYNNKSCCPILQRVEFWVANDSLQEASHQAPCLLSFTDVATQCRLFTSDKH